MSSVATRSRWRFLVTPRWLAWHAFAVVAFWGMLWLGDWQFHRAEGGNALSWAYTFEWPVFAIMGAVFWAKTIIDEAKPEVAEADASAVGAQAGAVATAGSSASRLSGPAGLLARREQARRAQAAEDEVADDPDLDEYNAYLARLNEQVQGHGRWHGLG
jgi:hypothetical protein